MHAVALEIARDLRSIDPRVKHAAQDRANMHMGAMSNYEAIDFAITIARMAEALRIGELK